MFGEYNERSENFLIHLCMFPSFGRLWILLRSFEKSHDKKILIINTAIYHLKIFPFDIQRKILCFLIFPFLLSEAKNTRLLVQVAVEKPRSLSYSLDISLMMREIFISIINPSNKSLLLATIAISDISHKIQVYLMELFEKIWFMHSLIHNSKKTSNTK